MIVINTEKLPIKIWAEEEDLEGFDEAIDQAKNLANHPLSKKYVCLMPDFHIGYGMPIGGVLATQGGVIANAVGVDIGCGMVAGRTNLKADDLSRELLQAIRLSVHKRIPVGMSHHKERQSSEHLDSYDFDDPVISKQLESAYYQIGSLGGGNHFIEIQADQNDIVWIMLHSGSRNLGLQVCNYYHKIAKDYMDRFHSDIPDMDLAFLPEGVKEYEMYLKAMQFCMKFAEDSRESMFKNVMAALEENGLKFDVPEKFDTHHNFASMENHFGQNLLIHRKGAVKAEGLVTIPGSMGTSSYICEGLKPVESFNSCSHGAGRVLGRKQANSIITHDQAVEAMQHVVFGIKMGDYDEMPMAYKDIDKVIEYQKDLVKPIFKLRPLAVCKG